MSRLTNDSTIYQAEIKKRLTETFESAYQPLWIYLEMTQNLDYGYSLVFLLKNNSYPSRRLLLRKWTYNSNKNQPNIFNLDNISIKEKELCINLNETFEIQCLRKKELGTVIRNTIVLDGYYKEFIDFQLKGNYQWNIDEDMNSSLRALINKLKSIIISFD